MTRQQALKAWLYFMNLNNNYSQHTTEEFKTIQEIGKRFIKRLNQVDEKKQIA